LGRGTVPLLSKLRPFHDKLVERVQIPFFSHLVLNPHRSSEMWIDPLASLVFIVFFLVFSSASRASGSKEGESRVLLCSNPRMLVPCMTIAFL
jgi:hypothetical protein